MVTLDGVMMVTLDGVVGLAGMVVLEGVVVRCHPSVYWGDKFHQCHTGSRSWCTHLTTTNEKR